MNTVMLWTCNGLQGCGERNFNHMPRNEETMLSCGCGLSTEAYKLEKMTTSLVWDNVREFPYGLTITEAIMAGWL